VAPGEGDPERLLEKGDLVQPAVARRRRQNGRVQLARQQPRFQLLGHGLGQVELDLGQAVADRGQQDRREIRAEGRDHAEAQRPGQRIAPRRGRLLDLVRQGDQGARLGDDLLAQGRHPDAALGALEQGRAQLLFELADLGAQGRLAHMAGLGRLAEMAVVGDGDDVPQVADVHGAD
jgi:hypothetical protein